MVPSKDGNKRNDTEVMSNEEQERQRQYWRAMKRSIYYQVDRCNELNIKEVIVELFNINILKGRGLLVRRIMYQQLRRQRLTDVYAALVCVLNSKIPQIGKLLMNRVILLFRKSYARSSKKCYSVARFLSQLVNQKVCSEVLVLQILQLLLDRPTGASVELATTILIACGKLLLHDASNAYNHINDRLRNILHESTQQQIQRNIQKLFKIQRGNFKYNPGIPKGLDLVEEEDKETHFIELYSKISSYDKLNCFRIDKDFDSHEQKYSIIKKDILGGSDSENESEADESEEEKDKQVGEEQISANVLSDIKDMTSADTQEFQKEVYFTVMSSMSADEATHKLLRLNLKKDRDERKKQNPVLIDMLIKCCAQEKSYSKFYGLISEKICSLNKSWNLIFIDAFKSYYTTIHQLETNSIRNVGKLFGHLFAQEVLAIEDCWDIIELTEEATDPASRVFIKFIFQQMVEELGVNSLIEILDDSVIKESLNGMMPRINLTSKDAERLRFSINYFTAIGLGILSEEMRSLLKDLPPDKIDEQNLENPT